MAENLPETRQEKKVPLLPPGKRVQLLEQPIRPVVHDPTENLGMPPTNIEASAVVEDPYHAVFPGDL